MLVQTLGPCHRSQQVANLLFGPAVRALVHAALGTPGYLFNDQVSSHMWTVILWKCCTIALPQYRLAAAWVQYIVKPPQSPLSAFGWHRDSDWMRKEQMDGQPYISVGCATMQWFQIFDVLLVAACAIPAMRFDGEPALVALSSSVDVPGRFCLQ